MTMTWTMIAIIGGAGVAGLLLLLAGWRGRRIDDHPWCRRCRFDLYGLTGGLRVCPECGANLISDDEAPDAATQRRKQRQRQGRGSAIRIGQRRRSRAMISVGLIVMLGSASLLGFVGYHRLKGFNWITITPTFMLMNDTASSNDVVARPAIAELTRRLALGRIGEGGRLDTLISRGLDRQSDRDRAWLVEWGDFLETAMKSGLLNKSQIEAYCINAAVLSLKANDRAQAGQKWTVLTSLTDIRVGRVASMWISGHPVEIRVGEELLRTPDDFARGGGVGLQGASSASFGFSPTVDVEPGAYPVLARWLIDVHTGFDGESIATFERTFSDQLEVVGAGVALIERVNDPELREKVKQSINVRMVRAQPAAAMFEDANESVENLNNGVDVMVSINFNNAPVDLAFEVVLRDKSGREWVIGPMTYPMAMRGAAGRAISEHFDSFEPSNGEVNVVLRPSVAAAALTPGLEQVWDEAIVFDDVRVTRPPDTESGG